MTAVETVGITDADERLHPVEDPSPHWSDSLYFNAWDPTTDTFLMTRIAVLANAARVTAGMIVWRDGAPVYGYGRELSELPTADWDVMTVDGLTYRMLSSGDSGAEPPGEATRRHRAEALPRSGTRSTSSHNSLWAAQLADGEHQAHLEWRGLGPAVSYDAHPGGGLPRAVAWGHYEQTCRVTGDLTVGGERVRFDGWGQRDHSWGFRHWAGLHQWHWVTGFLADGRGFNLFEVQSHSAVTTVNGFVQSATGSEYVVSATRDSVRSADGGMERFRLTLRLAGGEELAISGDRAGTSIPVRPAEDQPVVVHETPMRLDADGVAGYGIYEHLVTEFD